MVGKLALELTEDSTRGHSGPARVVYTGTGRRYLCDSLRTVGEFRNPGSGNVYLSESPWSAIGYAASRAKFYLDVPILLIVDTYKLEGRFHYDGRYRAKALNIGSFLPHEIALDKEGRISEEECHRILRMEDLVTQMPQEEVRQQIARFLSRERPA